MDVSAAILSLVALTLALIAISNASNLRHRLELLEREVSRLRTEYEAPEIAEPAGQYVHRQRTRQAGAASAIKEPASTEVAGTPQVTAGPAPSLASVASAVIEASGVPNPVGLLEPAVPVPPRVPRKPVLQPLVERARSTDEWEALIGGRWFNRIGAMALILGMALFLKYAIDNNWIAPPLRVSIGLAVGVSLLEGARRTFRKDLVIFAQGLVGAGLAILYLSLYASSNLYHLIPAPLALAAMGGVTALAFLQALYYDSLSVALLAWLGGFATVPLLGISSGDTIAAIGYVVLLDAGILAIVARRDRWFILEPLAMGATYAIYFGWHTAHYNSSMRLMAAVALTIFWGLFYALDVWRILARVTTYAALRHVLGGSNVALYLGAMAILLANGTSIGLLSLALGALYLATILLGKRHLTADRLDARYTLTAIVLAVLATPLLTSGFLLPILWSVEALALLAAGIRWNLWYVWGPSLWLYGLVAAVLVAIPGAIAYEPIAGFVPLFNERSLAFLILTASLVAGSFLLRRLPQKRAASFVSAFQYAWCAVLFLLLSVETADFFRRQTLGADSLTQLQMEQMRALVMAAVWVAFALPFVFYGLRRQVFPYLSSGLAAAALGTALGAGAGFAYQPIERFTLILNDRFLILGLLIAGLIVLRRLLLRNRDVYPWIDTALTGYQAVVLMLGFELATVEIHDFFRHATGTLAESGGASGVFVELMTLSALWLLYSFPLVRYGIRNRALSVFLIGLGSLGAATSAGAVASLAFEPTGWLGLALSLRPLVVIGLMVGLLLQLRFMRQAQSIYRWLDTVILLLQACTVLLGLELVSAQTRDVFQHQISTGSNVDMLQNLQQLTYSVVWLLYAIGLLLVGFWRRVRWLRLGAIVLLGFIILKIVGYDLSFLSPAYRSISFAGLGVILLACSYLYQRYRGRLLEEA